MLFPAKNYLFKLTKKKKNRQKKVLTPFWCFIVNFEQILHLLLVLLCWTLNKEVTRFLRNYKNEYVSGQSELSYIPMIPVCQCLQIFLKNNM